jgi:UDP-2,3-diacylglucosamine pyrophosphatase LpxH
MIWWKEHKEAIRDIATEKQLLYMAAVEEHGNVNRAAGALSVTESTVRRSLQYLRKKAINTLGVDPQIAQKTPLAGSQRLSGTSTLVRFPENDPEGRVMQWVKANVDKDEQYRLMAEAIREFAADYDGYHAPTKPPTIETDDLLTAYVWGDPHIGMYSWAEETGADFDLKIAEELMTKSMARLISSAPASRDALIINVGDFFHADNLENKTSRSGNVLDIDTRMSKVYQVGVMIQHMCIDAALQKHERVKVINAIGNHDDLTAMTLATTMAAWYRDEPRVEIVTVRNKFHWHEFGKVLLCVTHGDSVRAREMGEVMAAYNKGKPWGRTEWRYALMGHLHKNDKIKTPGRGWSAEVFPTIASLDAWGASKGFYPDRAMFSIVYDREFGELERHRVCVEMVES